MFSGIVETTGRIVAIREERGNRHFTLECPFTGELKIDQSVAHNGVCLTVVEVDGSRTHTVYLKHPFVSPPDFSVESCSFNISALMRDAHILEEG